MKLIVVPNAASKRVLEKVGLKYVSDIEYKSPTEAAPRRVSWYEAINKY